MIKVKDPHSGRVFETDYKLGKTLAELTELFGEEQVCLAAREKMKTILMNRIREQMKKGKTSKEIRAGLTGWKPFQRFGRKLLNMQDIELDKET